PNLPVRARGTKDALTVHNLVRRLEESLLDQFPNRLPNRTQIRAEAITRSRRIIAGISGHRSSSVDSQSRGRGLVSTASVGPDLWGADGPCTQVRCHSPGSGSGSDPPASPDRV